MNVLVFLLNALVPIFPRGDLIKRGKLRFKLMSCVLLNAVIFKTNLLVNCVLQ